MLASVVIDVSPVLWKIIGPSVAFPKETTVVSPVFWKIIGPSVAFSTETTVVSPGLWKIIV